MKEEERLRDSIREKLGVGDTALAQFIGFFLRKVKIEEDHANLCMRLAHESAASAASFGIEKLWAPFLESCRRDAQHRQSMAQLLKAHVIAKLEGLKGRRNVELERVVADIMNIEASAAQALSKSRDDVGKLKSAYREKGIKLQQLNQIKDTSLPKSLKLQKELSVAETEYRQSVWKREEERLKFCEKRNSAIQHLAKMENVRHAVIIESVSTFADLERQCAEESIKVAQDYRDSLAQIDIEQERSNYVHYLEDTWQNYAPIYYWHVSEGDSKDLVFGVPLDVHLRATQRPVPFILQKCIRAIEQRGLKKEGIYRVSAKHSDIMELRQRLEKDISKVNLEDESYDVNVICGVVKMFLRELPKPLLEIPDIERKEYPQKSPEDRIRSIQFFLKNENKATLKYLIYHLATVAQHSEDNKMTAQNLAVVFGPPILTNTQKDNSAQADGLKTKTQQFLDKMQQRVQGNLSGPGSSPSTSATDLGLNMELAKNDIIIEEMIRDRELIFPPEKVPKKDKKNRLTTAEFPSRFDSLPLTTAPTGAGPLTAAVTSGVRNLSMDNTILQGGMSPLSSSPHLVSAGTTVQVQPAPIQLSVPAPIPVSLLASSYVQHQPPPQQQQPQSGSMSPTSTSDVPPPPPLLPIASSSNGTHTPPQPMYQSDSASSSADPLLAAAWHPSHSFPPVVEGEGGFTGVGTMAYRSPSQGFAFLAPSLGVLAGPAPGGVAASVGGEKEEGRSSAVT
ncbi:hypothetical protein HDU67_009249, partial [Dinochytrium kinnereticum]